MENTNSEKPKRNSITAGQKMRLSGIVKEDAEKDPRPDILTDESKTTDDIREHYAKKLGVEAKSLPMSTLSTALEAWGVVIKRKARPKKSPALIRAEERIKQLEVFITSNSLVVPEVTKKE